MAADIIGRTGASMRMFYSDLSNLQSLAKRAGTSIEMEVEYSRQQAKELHSQLSKYKEEVIGVHDTISFDSKGVCAYCGGAYATETCPSCGANAKTNTQSAITIHEQDDIVKVEEFLEFLEKCGGFVIY